ncbi:helix-turn-helix domain-containing protein [Lactobacillus xujianguonis]|uniref:helix-turn-helix domain-containing protein n=1 Tax=Lactobacillus xujianguonis TaxID=2495899 RepID=UPI000FD7E1A6|nr:helix-turn-helix domain-containing protein [Lactobacillus xujianguonis]RVU74116.1 helix-turn-helix domain-containing protein [Lactobacillus xujianguonis]
MKSEFKGARAFLMIPPSISRDKDLLKKPKSIILMGEIISMLNVTGNFHMSNKTLADILDTTPKSVNDWLNLLEDKGLIIREQITIPAQNPKNEKSKRILGRTIKAGPNLVTQSLLGWERQGSRGGNVDVSRVVTPTSHKHNSINRSSNITVNNSSSAKKEEDPEREKIYQDLFLIVRASDKAKNQSTRPSLDEIKQMRSLLYKCSLSTLQATKDKFKAQMEWDMVGKPFAYLLKLLRDGLSTERDYESESWG